MLGQNVEQSMTMFKVQNSVTNQACGGGGVVLIKEIEAPIPRRETRMNVYRSTRSIGYFHGS